MKRERRDPPALRYAAAPEARAGSGPSRALLHGRGYHPRAPLVLLPTLASSEGSHRDDAADAPADAPAEAPADAYEVLRRRAGRLTARERPDHTLTPTALVHEAFLRVVRNRLEPEIGASFVAAASLAMRRILIEHARARVADRRDRRRHVDVELDSLPTPDREARDGLRGEDLVAALREVSGEHAAVFEARILRGATMDAIATDLGVSRRTAQYRLRAALAWLVARFVDE